MLKICMVVHQYYYRDTRVKRYAEALVEAGAAVDVLCLRDPQRPSVAIEHGVRLFTIPIRRSAVRLAGYLLEYTAALFLFSMRLVRLYFSNRYHAIHVHNMPDFLIFSALIPKLFGAKLILDIHDPMPEFYMSKKRRGSDGLLVRLFRLEEKISCWLSHAIITANAGFKDCLVRRGIAAGKIMVINNVADPNVFSRSRFPKPQPDDAYFTLIYPGTIAPRYALDIAIRALTRLVMRIPHLRLRIIGPKTEHVAELSALAEQLGVSDYVEFKPAIPVAEVPAEIIKADAGIYTAMPDFHMSIAMPCKVLEYAAMGIPIIATRLDVLERVFGDTGILYFSPGQVDDFARCVLTLYENPALRRRLAHNAEQMLARSFSWPSERDRYFGLLNRLVEMQVIAIYAEKRTAGASQAAK